MNFRFLSKTTNQTILTASIFVIMFSLSGNVWGANVYIDPDWSGKESGTCAEPYNSWTDIAFSASNDYYQKSGSTENITKDIDINNIKGSSENRVIIGAYYKTGKVCAVGVSGAKPILNRNNTSGSTFNPNNSTYLQFENLDLRGGESTLFLRDSSDNAIIKDCNIGLNSHKFGIRIKASNDGEIFNNIVDSNSQVSGTGLSDGINLGTYSGIGSDRWKVYHNKIYNWRHTQIAINTYSDSNDIYNNYAEGTECDSDNPCRGFEVYGFQATYNLVHHNYFYNFNQHSQILRTSYNRIYCNVWDTTRSPANEAFIFQVNGSTDVSNNKFYNNLVYNSNGYGIRFYISLAGTGKITGNELVNNIFLEWGSGTAGIKIANNEDIFANTFKNNLYFSSGDSTIVNYRNPQKTLAQWLNENDNAYGDVISNELNSNPSLKNPGSGQFWPDAVSDPVVGAGINLGSPFDQILSPDSDFKLSLPTVKTIAQPADWYIGPYAFELHGKMINPPPRIVSGFRVSSR